MFLHFFLERAIKPYSALPAKEAHDTQKRITTSKCMTKTFQILKLLTTLSFSLYEPYFPFSVCCFLISNPLI